MKYIAVICIGRNTMVSIPLENHDDPESEVTKDAEQLAKALGGRFLYLEDVE